MSGKRRCAFRLDDITADMNWNHFNRICGIFDRYQVKPLLGIVPDCRDGHLHVEEADRGFWDRMRALQEKGYAMAQHGCTHVYETTDGGLLGLNPFSEFAGLPYGIQEEKIRRGKQILQKQGIYVTIFMAPGHTFDRNTLKALKENGFTHITDGYSSRIYRRCGILHIPSRKSEPGLENGTDTICLHVNSMREEDFDRLERFLRVHGSAAADFRDLLEEPGLRRGAGIILEEKKNLWMRRIKKFAGTNQTLQEYLRETAGADRKSSMKKRICGLPRLARRVAGRRGSRK